LLFPAATPSPKMCLFLPAPLFYCGVAFYNEAAWLAEASSFVLFSRSFDSPRTSHGVRTRIPLPGIFSAPAFPLPICLGLVVTLWRPSFSFSSSTTRLTFILLHVAVSRRSVSAGVNLPTPPFNFSLPRALGKVLERSPENFLFPNHSVRRVEGRTPSTCFSQKRNNSHIPFGLFFFSSDHLPNPDFYGLCFAMRGPPRGLLTISRTLPLSSMLFSCFHVSEWS